MFFFCFLFPWYSFPQRFFLNVLFCCCCSFFFFFFLCYFTQRLLVVFFFLKFLVYYCIKEKGRQLYKNYCLLTLLFLCVCFALSFSTKDGYVLPLNGMRSWFAFFVFPTVVYEEKKETEKARIMCAKAEIKLLLVLVFLLLLFKIKMM